MKATILVLALFCSTYAHAVCSSYSNPPNGPTGGSFEGVVSEVEVSGPRMYLKFDTLQVGSLGALVPATCIGFVLNADAANLPMFHKQALMSLSLGYVLSGHYSISGSSIAEITRLRVRRPAPPNQ